LSGKENVSKRQHEVIDELKQASNRGRTIVPLLGAGISVESGIPALAALTQYLAKVQYYISRGGLLSSLHQRRTQGSTYKDFQERYGTPRRYLQDFGWPDPYQLNADLWRWFEEEEKIGPEHRSLLERTVQEELLNDMSRLDEGIVGRIRALHIEGPKLLGHPDTPRELREELKDLLSNGWELQGNWRSLLSHLTDANPDFADTLFQRLIRDREPSTAHRFFAFLTPLMGFRLFLTINFDNLLEQALRLEGLQPIVYDVSRSSALPHPSLLQQGISVVKLHGGTYGLRVGETLDQPLDADSSLRLKDYLPTRPILLVMGVGGWDRRILDLVDLVIERDRGEHGKAADGLHSVYWMHFESECPLPVRRLVETAGDGAVCPVRTYNPGAFLMELYARLVGAHPQSFHPYNPQIPRPVVPPDSKPKKEERPLRFFVDAPDGYGLGASHQLARLVAERSRTHIPIWIDLEAMQTVPEVVADIFRQIRKYDTSLPPLAHEDGRGAVVKSIRRIYDVLQRGRYLLAFNAIGSFGRPPTYHHGSPASVRKRITAPLTRFLYVLYQAAHFDREWPQQGQVPAACKGRLKDSILAFAVDRLTGAPAGEDLPQFYCKVARDRSDLVESIDLLPAAPLLPPSEEDLDRYREALLLVAAFRRRRSWIALRQLLPAYLPEDPGVCASPAERAANLLLHFEERGYLLRVEGGYYWMSRRLRDLIYRSGQTQTSSAHLRGMIAAHAAGKPVGWEISLRQLTCLASIHDDLAVDYYASMFAASQEIQAFLEHLYHRVSCLRYLTKLDSLLLAFPAAFAEATKRISRMLESSADGAGERPRLSHLRLRQLRSLRKALLRERERLLSAVPADTLVRWIDWIQTQDLPRFWIEICLETTTGSGRQNPAAARRFREALRSAGAPPEAAETSEEAPERRILAECGELFSELDHLKGIVLRDKMDFKGCMRLRSSQIFRLPVGLSAEEAAAADPECGWLADPRVLSTLGEQAAALPPKDLRRLVGWLGDIWTSLRWRGERERAAQVRQLVERVARAAEAHPESDGNPDIDTLRIRALRHRADHELMGISPWDLRGASWKKIADAEERCRKAVELSGAALKTLAWAKCEGDARHNSYFHSLRGRAMYLLGELRDAHREIDLSQVGLAPSLGADREALAASLLRLAECLMVRADDVILECCRKAAPREPALEDLSPEGLLCLIGGQIRWPKYAATIDLPLRLRLQTAAGVWLQTSAKRSLGWEASSEDAAYRRLKDRIGEDRARSAERSQWSQEQIEKWELEWPPERIQELATAQAWRSPESVRRLWERCLSNWSVSALTDASRASTSELTVALARAEGRLRRAKGVLDRAEGMLTGARQNLEWWTCLYQLRAQIQIELLLHQITSPVEDWKGQRSQFIARFTSAIEKGLRAIRQGLDVMLPGEIEETTPGRPRDIRVTRLLRMWIELMLCGGYLTRLVGRRDGKKPLSESTLWQRWDPLNRSARISRLLNAKDFFSRYDPLSAIPDSGEWLGIESRAGILTAVKSCLRSGGIAALVLAHQEGADDKRLIDEG
jgi:hypothetical protein